MSDVKNCIIHPTAKVAKCFTHIGNGRVEVGPFSIIEEGVKFNTGNGNRGRITIGSRSKIKTGVIIKSYGNSVEILNRVTIGEYCLLAGHGGLSIGNCSMIGPYVLINAAEHIIGGNVEYRFQGEIAKGIVLGQNIWLGARVSVLDGVLIGSHTIVGAHSLVNKSLPESVLAVGTPSKIQKHLKREDGDEGFCKL